LGPEREGIVDVSEGSLSPFHLYAPTMLSPESQGAGDPDLAMDAAGDFKHPILVAKRTSRQALLVRLADE